MYTYMVYCTCDWVFYSVIAPISGRGPAHQQHGGKTAPRASATVTSSGVRGHGHGTTERLRERAPQRQLSSEGDPCRPSPKDMSATAKNTAFWIFCFSAVENLQTHSPTSILQHSSSITFTPREPIDHQQLSNAHSNASSAHPPSVSLTQQHWPPSTNNQPVFLTLDPYQTVVFSFYPKGPWTRRVQSFFHQSKVRTRVKHRALIYQCIAYYCSVVDAVFACRLSECLQRL